MRKCMDKMQLKERKSERKMGKKEEKAIEERTNGRKAK